MYEYEWYLLWRLPDNGVTNYAWSLPSGASISTGSGTHSITVDFGGNALSGSICVTASNVCGKSGYM
ncbi:MAG: hypothetical protein IPP46_04265 [Bacteroidetes bacterium]|nr:hypothetical protein [Bacteroidota bacterium]